MIIIIIYLFFIRVCLDIIPHKHFTFSKMWPYYAQFEIRQKNLNVARKTLVSFITKYFFFFLCIFDLGLSQY